MELQELKNLYEQKLIDSIVKKDYEYIDNKLNLRVEIIHNILKYQEDIDYIKGKENTALTEIGIDGEYEKIIVKLKESIANIDKDLVEYTHNSDDRLKMYLNYSPELIKQ